MSHEEQSGRAERRVPGALQAFAGTEVAVREKSRLTVNVLDEQLTFAAYAFEEASRPVVEDMTRTARAHLLDLRFVFPTEQRASNDNPGRVVANVEPDESGVWHVTDFTIG